MTKDKKLINDFVSQKDLAIIGVSSNPKKFGNYIFKELKKKGYNIFPIHNKMESIENSKCYSSLDRLPNPVDGVVINVSPEKAKAVVSEVARQGIRKVWLQQGSSNEDVIKECEKNDLSYIEGQCIIMFAEPVGSFHKFHKWIWKLIGRYPN